MTFPDREFTDVWFEHVIAELTKVNNVPLCLWVCPHAIVHRRHDQHGRLRGEETRSEQITRLSAGCSRHEIGRRGRDQDELRGTRKVNVIQGVTSLNQFRVHRTTRQRFKRDRPDKLRCRFRKDDVDFSSRLREQSCQPRRFVAGYPSRNSEKDAAAGIWPDGSYSWSRRRATTRYSI
jgi:hypothetical protein